MKYSTSPQEIGRRIAILRKQKGLNQEDLAKRVGLSRPSLAQIELGNRNIDVLELQRIAMVLHFSLDDIVSKEFKPVNLKHEDSTSEAETNEERISVPKLNVEKFKNVLLYILERCAGKPNVGETVLYKLLYFSDFNHYELYEEHLTGAKYRKLPYGPVPQKLNSIIEQMLGNGQIQRFKSEYHGLAQTRYMPLMKADLTVLKASEKEVIDKVIDQLSDWNATAISDYSHKDLPWLVTEQGEDINYELALYRELPYSVRVYNDNEE